jgi:hypothetical protein
LLRPAPPFISSPVYEIKSPKIDRSLRPVVYTPPKVYSPPEGATPDDIADSLHHPAIPRSAASSIRANTFSNSRESLVGTHPQQVPENRDSDSESTPYNRTPSKTPEPAAEHIDEAPKRKKTPPQKRMDPDPFDF